MPSGDEKDKVAPRGPLARRWLMNAVLLIVVAGFGVFAWYRGAYPPTEAKPQLTDVKADAVQKIEIARPRQPIVRLERADGGWRLTTPITARADSFAVNSLLRVLQAPVDGDITPTDDNLARYGLQPPQLVVRFDTTEVAFGERHPLKDERYVKFGSAVRLVAGQYYAQASVRATNLIDSRLIEPGRKLTSIKLPDFTLTQKDGAWKREPEIAALSSDRINAFVDEWRHARALQVEVQKEKKKILDTVVLGFEKPDGGTSVLNIGVLARRPELVLHRADENLDYHFPEDTGDRLLTLSEK
jgi:hypothetical protein